MAHERIRHSAEVVRAWLLSTGMTPAAITDDVVGLARRRFIGGATPRDFLEDVGRMPQHELDKHTAPHRVVRLLRESGFSAEWVERSEVDVDRALREAPLAAVIVGEMLERARAGKPDSEVTAMLPSRLMLMENERCDFCGRIMRTADEAPKYRTFVGRWLCSDRCREKFDLREAEGTDAEARERVAAQEALSERAPSGARSGARFSTVDDAVAHGLGYTDLTMLADGTTIVLSAADRLAITEAVLGEHKLPGLEDVKKNFGLFGRLLAPPKPIGDAERARIDAAACACGEGPPGKSCSHKDELARAHRISSRVGYKPGLVDRVLLAVGGRLVFNTSRGLGVAANLGPEEQNIALGFDLPEGTSPLVVELTKAVLAPILRARGPMHLIVPPAAPRSKT